jgi:UDP-glucose 4-epimerase
MKIKITGSEGCGGRHLSKRLVDYGYEIVKLDSLGLDLTDKESFKLSFDSEIIVHLVAKTYVPESLTSPYDFYYSNYIGTLNVLEAARIYHSKVIFISTYVYGIPEKIPITEDHKADFLTPYSKSKLLCENLCKVYIKDFAIPVFIFRLFNIYGPGQDNRFLIKSILNQMKNAYEKLKDPKPKRDYLFVFDFVEAIFKEIIYFNFDFDIINLGTGKSYSVEAIVEIISNSTNKKFFFEFEKLGRKNEILECYADIKNEKKILN